MAAKIKLDKIEHELNRRTARGRSLIRKLCAKPGRFSREDRLRIAKLAGKADLPELTLGVLRSAVVGKDGRGQGASDEEKAEYGYALVRMSALHEARKILLSVNLKRCPRAAIYLALGCFRISDWETPCVSLEAFIRSQAPGSYEQLRGKVFLGLALVHGKPDLIRSQRLLESVARETGPNHHPDLHTDALQILAQNFLFQRKWKLAKSCLEQAESVDFEGSDGSRLLTLQQWKAIASIYTGGDISSATRELFEIESKFLAMERWEQARQCAFYRAGCLKDGEQLLRLYFGTPYPRFRKKILVMLELLDVEFPELYELSVGQAARKKSAWISVLDGENNLGSERLKPGQALQRLFAALAADIYNPANLTRLHESVYPEERFNPNSSPVRVRQLLKRLRDWIARNRIPLEIVESRGLYRLQSKTGVILRVPRDVDDMKMHVFVARMRERFGAHSFRSNEARQVLGVSSRTAQHLLKDAISNGLIEKAGKTAAAVYRLKLAS